MAEGYEPYHVPQQSRRDKLRIVAHNQHNHQSLQQPLQAGLLPLYDPSSLISSDLLTCAADFHSSSSSKAVKDEDSVTHHPHHVVNLMGFLASSSSAASNSAPPPHQQYMDPNHLSENPNSVHDISHNSFLYSHHNLHNLRALEQAFNGGGGSGGGGDGGGIVLYKPVPQGLSLSLSSHEAYQHHCNSNLELNLPRYGGGDGGFYAEKITTTMVGGGGSSLNNEVARNYSVVPLGPFTGYAAILKGSKFLKPAQQLLEEFCDLGCGGLYSVEKVLPDSSLMDPPPNESLSMDDPSHGSCSGGDVSEVRRKKSRLISILDEVYWRYKQYYQQMQAVVASFEYVAGLGNAAPYANLALKAMSKHFRCLKNAITDQLQVANKAHGQVDQGKDEAARFGNPERNFSGQRALHGTGFLDQQPVWRSQRGLPERAVTVLRAWLFDHFLHPYPTDTDKLRLAKQTGLSRSQVSNWFINARVRLWKPMVEEIHNLEMRQSQKPMLREETSTNNRSSDQLPSASSLASENPSTSTQRAPDAPLKRTRNELSDHHLPMGSNQPLNLSYNNLSNHPHVGLGVSMAGVSSGVSLTLGLHQNNGINLSSSETFPINGAQRYGYNLDEGYVMAGFDVQNRHFGRDLIGGQFLHDFVG